MGYSCKIITRYQNFDFDDRVHIMKKIMQKLNYFFSFNSRDELFVSEYLCSECRMMIYLDDNYEECRLNYDSDYIDPICFNKISQNGDMLLKILREYFIYYPNDYMITDSSVFFDKTIIDKIYNTNNWRGWFDADVVNRKFEDIYYNNCVREIKYKLKRNGLWQLILRKTLIYDFEVVKDFIFSFIENNNYRYFTEEKHDKNYPQYIHFIMYIVIGDSGGNCLKFDIMKEINVYNNAILDNIKIGISHIMTIQYLIGGRNVVRDFMVDYFKKFPEDIMYGTNGCTLKEGKEYTKDTILSFGE